MNLDSLISDFAKLSAKDLEKLVSEKLTDEQVEKLAENVDKELGDQQWFPNPGPQTQAYYSRADILLFGGEPGGGKTGLGLGLALTQHYRSLVVRKQFTDLDGVIDNLAGMLASDKGLVRGNRPKYKKPGGGVINFQGMGQTGELDTGKQGNPHDLIYVDEAAQLAEVDIRLLIGWNRISSDSPTNQRCRVVLGSNPPVNATGDWLASFFAPWLDDTHGNPAKPGELRWFYFDEDGKSVETEHQKPFEIDEKTYYPQSRTYIPSRLEDNPYQNPEEYRKNLQSIPEPFRSMLTSGNFLVARQDQKFQLIPTNWVREAVGRWEKNPFPPAGIPMCTMGCDVAQGGKDYFVIANRYDYWYDKLIKIPGKDVPEGSDLAGHIVKHRRHDAEIVLDMGGGYGSGAWSCLKDNVTKGKLKAFKGAEAGIGRSKDKQYSFVNARTAAYWLFMEALDPTQPGGSPICLPRDARLIAGLTTPTYEVTPRGIKIENKEEVIKKLGYSPDESDSVVMAYYQGHRGLTPHRNHSLRTNRSMQTKASTGRENRRR
jgi:hypothetical protein